jgi:autotransporter strand-loop-strand O-heptosyltransferase
MNFDNVLAVCSFLGTAGYNYHARGFFTALNKLLPVGVKNWSGDENPYYLTNEQKAMMAAASGNSFSFGKSITICLHETNHEDWYKHNYLSPKIAFNVWESTRQPEKFFSKLLEFDQIWVPSQWQKECTIDQGAPEDKIFVIPEGYDTARFRVGLGSPQRIFSSEDKFTFTIAGRWEYRKATTEMIRAFTQAFENHNDVELLLLVDNPFDRERRTTEDKLDKFGLEHKNIKVIHKVSQEHYDQLIQETDCFISCSRSEGWNLPLMEFMACGVPVICTDWSGQTEFISDYANRVQVAGYKKAWSEFGEFPGEYAEPDFEHLKHVMQRVYAETTGKYRRKALDGAEYIKKFTWENAAKIALNVMEPLRVSSPITKIAAKVLGDESTGKKEMVVSFEPKEPVAKKIRSKDIVVIGCYPDSEEKLKKLNDTIAYVNKLDKPVAIVTHLPLPMSIQEQVDYFIYDADNSMPDYRLPIVYTFDSLKLSGFLDRPYHCLPIVKSLQNVSKAFSNFERIHFIEYDINVDLEKHLANVLTHKDKEFVSYNYESTGVYTNIMSFKPSLMLDILTKRTITWEDYKKMAAPVLWEQDLIFENWMYRVLVNNGKTEALTILDAHSIDMGSDISKQIPKYNYIFCETDDDQNIMFISHRQMTSSTFKVKEFSRKEVPLVDCGDFSYVLLDKSVNEVTVYRHAGNNMISSTTFDISSERKGEFVFYDRPIKCKKVERLKDSNPKHNIQIKNFFIDGAFLELLGPDSDLKYGVEFTDRQTGQVVHKSELTVNHWTKTNRKYFTDWNVRVHNNGEDVYNRDISYFQRRVLIVLDSKAMGDTLAWFPMVERFRKKHNAHVICVTFWNRFFKDRYPEITFVEPGTVVPDIFAQFNVGCFDNDLNKNKFNWRITPLQKLASDILGLTPYVEEIPNISYKVMDRPIKEKYVAISEHSTFLSKYWLNPNGWKKVIDYLNDEGYVVAAISKEPSELQGVVNLTNRPIEESISNIHHAEMFIGMSSGPSWLAWALRKPLILVSGYSTEWAEMNTGNPMVRRIINTDVCHGCFNDPSLPLERGNWRWCPRGRDFECSKMITAEQVIDAIKYFQRGI